MNTENVEARLCDYIENQLDEAGRAEIEQHLQTNPQHRQLLVELMQMRDWVRQLPMESAPAEILDSLQSQLERSVLLQTDDEQTPDLVLHVRRLPQFIAIAAMLLLAVGLAAVIYYVLPPAVINRPELATLPRFEEPEMPTEFAAATPSILPDRVSLRERSSGDEVFTLSRNLPPLPGPMLAVREYQDIFALRPASAMRHHPPMQGRLLVVVTTTDPRAANTDVTEFLSSNRMEWQPMNQAMPAPAEVQQMVDALASRNRRQQVTLKAAQESPKDQVAQRSPAHSYDIRATIPPAPEPERDAPLGAAGAAAVPDARQRNELSGSPGVTITGRVDVEAPPAAMERREMEQSDAARDAAVPPVAKSQAAEQKIADDEKTKPQEDVQPPAVGLPGAEDFALQEQKPSDVRLADSEQIIVVRNMTKRQAAALSDTLSNRRHGQRAEMIDESQAHAGAMPEFVGLTPTGDSSAFDLDAGGPTTGPATRPSLATQPTATTLPTTRSHETSGESAMTVEEDQPVDVVIVVQDVGDATSADPATPPATQPTHHDLRLQPTMP